MKKYVIIATMLSICLFCVCGCQKKSSKKTVVLNEVAHSIFYAPQYVAIEKGYFVQEGIDLVLETGFGADKTMTAVLSGDADIGFMGPEATIYQYQQGNKDYAVNFAQLTQRAGNFLVSRKKIKDFKWEDLKGKDVIGGRKGGMPEMIFEYVLRKHGIHPKKDIKMIQNIDFANTAGAFSGGKGDFTVEFEPSATALENQKAGYVVSSLGVESGYVPYTTYCAKKSYLKKNSETIKAFVRAIEKGQTYVKNHSAEEIAEVIAPQFKETKEADLIKILNRYMKQDTYKTTATFDQDGYELLQDILEDAGELQKRIPFDVLVDNSYITP